jgi:hypothetical protein
MILYNNNFQFYNSISVLEICSTVMNYQLFPHLFYYLYINTKIELYRTFKYKK